MWPRRAALHPSASRGRPGQQLWAEAGLYLGPLSLCVPGGRQRRFSGKRKPYVQSLGPSPLAPPTPPGLSPVLCPKQKQSNRVLPPRSAWKASPRGPRPSLPGREARLGARWAARLPGLRRALLRGGVAVGHAAGMEPATAEGPPWGQEPRAAARADRLEESGRTPLRPICRAVKLGRVVRARAACGRGRRRLSARAFRVLSSRQLLCLEGGCQALRRCCPPPSPNLYPLR